MPPEAFQGDVTTKMDTYSFGVVSVHLYFYELFTPLTSFSNTQVILELMTGLPPCDECRTEMNLVSIFPLLDANAWKYSRYYH